MLLLSSGCLFHLPLRLIARLGRNAGFAGLEVIMNSPRLCHSSELDGVDALLPIKSLHAPFRRWSDWGGHLAAWKATTSLANSLPNVDHITLHPPGTRLANMIANRWFEKAHDLALLLDAKGRVRFSLETMPWVRGSPFGRHPFEQLLELCRDKNVGLTFDVCHMGVSGLNIMDAIGHVPDALLYNVHFSDAKGYTEHLSPGKGDLPLDDFLKHLGKRGYDGYLTLELEPSAFPDDLDASTEILAGMRTHIETRLMRGAKEA